MKSQTSLTKNISLIVLAGLTLFMTVTECKLSILSPLNLKNKFNDGKFIWVCKLV